MYLLQNYSRMIIYDYRKMGILGISKLMLYLPDNAIENWNTVIEASYYPAISKINDLKIYVPAEGTATTNFYYYYKESNCKPQLAQILGLSRGHKFKNFKESLTYNPLQQITSIKKEINSDNDTETQVSLDYTTDYQYDNLGQLIGSRNDNLEGMPTEYSYSYDLMGKRDSSTVVSGVKGASKSRYIYNDANTAAKNRLSTNISQQTVDGFMHNKESRYAYFSDGSLKERTVGQVSYKGNLILGRYHNESYGYNAWGQQNVFSISDNFSFTGGVLPPTVLPKPVSWCYNYTPSGRRERKKMYDAKYEDNNGNIYPWVYWTENSIWAGLQVSDESVKTYNHPNNPSVMISNDYLGEAVTENPSGAVSNSMVFLTPVEYHSRALGTSLIWKRAYDGNWVPHYQITDHLGNVIFSGMLVHAAYDAYIEYAGHSAMDYTPFGEPISLSQSQSREKYIGKETDFESGLADHGVRKYSAENGLFTCPDVLWEMYAGWSPYHYTRNNPINRKDFNGMDDFLYNGHTLFYRDNDRNVLWDAPANSGRGVHMNNPSSQDIENHGPVVEGEYYIKIRFRARPERSGGGWGLYGWYMHPTEKQQKKLDKVGRGGFFLHEDEKDDGTAGCVGVTEESGQIEETRELLKKYRKKGNKTIKVIIDYEFEHLYEDSDETGEPEKSSGTKHTGSGLEPIVF